MHENLGNEHEESDTVATREPNTPLCKKQRLRNCILNKSYQLLLIQCFLKSIFVQSTFHRDCDEQRLNSRKKFLPQSLLLSPMAKIWKDCV